MASHSCLEEFGPQAAVRLFAIPAHMWLLDMGLSPPPTHTHTPRHTVRTPGKPTLPLKRRKAGWLRGGRLSWFAVQLAPIGSLKAKQL